MSIEIISAWGNEIFLAPWFFKHYSFADRITILWDRFWDNIKEQVFKDKPDNINIIPIAYKGSDGGIDEMVKSRTLAEIYRSSTCDYCIVVDADEFVFGTKQDIESGYDFSKVKLYDVFRHVTDNDLDINVPIKEQRRHGFFRWMYNKPIVLKSGFNVDFDSGQHAIFVDGKRHNYILRGLPEDQKKRYKPGGLIGAHWCFADLFFCLERRTRKAARHGVRFTDYNKINEQSVIDECKIHENDGLVF
jgi:hypothetical protein